MHCYSQYSESKEECIKCDLAGYCKESTLSVPPLLCDRAKNIPTENLAKPLPVKTEKCRKERVYSHYEMLELISFLVAMDEKTLFILSEKVKNPMISLAEIGRKKNLTRQAIHKLIKTRCEQIPELSAVFNRKTEKSLTFMEAVCQIRQKSSELNSKEPEINSDYCRSLTSLKQSLDLSRLSIGKDMNY